MSRRFALSLNESPITCDGCGVCCPHMALPPYGTDELELLRAHWPDVWADYQAVRRTRELQLRATGVDQVPCGFLDMVTRKCRHHDLHPGVCQSFEVGGVFCRGQRYEAEL